VLRTKRVTRRRLCHLERSAAKSKDLVWNDTRLQSLTKAEYDDFVRCQIGTSKPGHGGRRYLPYAFTGSRKGTGPRFGPGGQLFVVSVHRRSYDRPMVRTRDDIVSLLKREKPQLCRRYPIRRIALFGSWARGEATVVSDVDILVDVAPSIGLDFVTLADDLERLLDRKVDLVSTRAVRPALWAEIEPELIDA